MLYLYTVIFLRHCRNYEEMRFTNPKEGDVVKVSRPNGGDPENWVILDVDDKSLIIYLEKQ